MAAQNSSPIRGSSLLPESTVTWGCIGIAIVFMALGVVISEGVLAGMFFIWGVSLLVAVFIARGALKVWSYTAD